MGAKQTALITGASGGIGLEFARVFAEKGYDLILIARREGALRDLGGELQKKFGTQTAIIAMDLAVPGAAKAAFAEVESRNLTVDVLVNNAGFATYGYFTDIDLDKQSQLLQLNIVTLTELTRLFLTGMKARGSGRVLNVASTAAFMSGPLMAVYYASKAYVLSFSEAIAKELEGTGVSVSVLCPGATESDFQARAAMQDSKLVQNGLMKANTVARIGYDGLMASKRVIIPGFMNRLVVLLPRLIPRQMVPGIVMNAQARISH
ncbi:MAG TPA: SDR family oxidoreductase [Aggregatilineales bacterium]|nr:SDR family oxidoreductase [Aggregatilineales bacterium]